MKKLMDFLLAAMSKTARAVAVGSSAVLGINWWYLIMFVVGSFYGWMTCCLEYNVINIRPDGKVKSGAIECPSARFSGNDLIFSQNLNWRLVGWKNDGVALGSDKFIQNTLTIWWERVQISNQISSASQLAPNNSTSGDNGWNRRVK
jgi:hypothetical protein